MVHDPPPAQLGMRIPEKWEERLLLLGTGISDVLDGSPTASEVPDPDPLKSYGKEEQILVANVAPLVLLQLLRVFFCIKTPN